MREFCSDCWSVCSRVFCAVILVGVSACSSPNILNDISEYQQRLSRVLDTDLSSQTRPVNTANHAVYPERDTLLQPPSGIDINLTRFHQLQQCELGNLVAEHNTALGKIQHFSQRLRYEQQFLAALTDCIELAESRATQRSSYAELAATMTRWQTIKEAEYTLHWSNMLVLSDETKAAFSRARPALLYEENIDIAGQVSLFKHLSRFADHHYQPKQSIEADLQAISATRLPATMWQAQQQVATHLPPLTAALKAQLANIDCTHSTPAEATILRNVFYLFFIEKIQPAGARLNDFAYQFAPVIHAWQASPALPDSFKRYLRLQQQGFTAYQQAMQQHVLLWQTFLGRCGLSPVASAGT
ncbi:MAG: DUF3080 family protein [Alteromonadaceae bacterium]|nr:DUF3080 family protein [Alteromonadaceae bacterium]